MNISKSKQEGFTMVELSVVLLIISIVSYYAISYYASSEHETEDIYFSSTISSLVLKIQSTTTLLNDHSVVDFDYVHGNYMPEGFIESSGSFELYGRINLAIRRLSDLRTANFRDVDGTELALSGLNQSECQAIVSNVPFKGLRINRVIFQTLNGEADISGANLACNEFNNNLIGAIL